MATKTLSSMDTKIYNGTHGNASVVQALHTVTATANDILEVFTIPAGVKLVQLDVGVPVGTASANLKAVVKAKSGSDVEIFAATSISSAAHLSSLKTGFFQAKAYDEESVVKLVLTGANLSSKKILVTALLSSEGTM